MNLPEPLKKGDKIQLVAPAGRVFESELSFAKKWAHQNEWELVYDASLFEDYNLGYHYAGTDEHRKTQVQNALNNPETKAIWFARGGYGSVKIIDYLDFSVLLKNPKWLIGYSDITVFHNYLNNYKFPTIHGVTAKQLDLTYSNETYDILQKILQGELPQYSIPSHPFNRTGKTMGKLVGGNLSILYSQLGSSTALRGSKLILFIEDWCEDWYHVDRMIMALKRSDLFQNVSGILVGSFTKMDVKEENPEYNSSFDSTTYQVLKAQFSHLNIPIAYGFPAGHIGDNRPLVLGKQVMFEVGKTQSQITYL